MTNMFHFQSGQQYTPTRAAPLFNFASITPPSSDEKIVTMSSIREWDPRRDLDIVQHGRVRCFGRSMTKDGFPRCSWSGPESDLQMDEIENCLHSLSLKSPDDVAYGDLATLLELVVCWRHRSRRDQSKREAMKYLEANLTAAKQRKASRPAASSQSNFVSRLQQQSSLQPPPPPQPSHSDLQQQFNALIEQLANIKLDKANLEKKNRDLIEENKKNVTQLQIVKNKTTDLAKDVEKLRSSSKEESKAQREKVESLEKQCKETEDIATLHKKNNEQLKAELKAGQLRLDEHALHEQHRIAAEQSVSRLIKEAIQLRSDLDVKDKEINVLKQQTSKLRSDAEAEKDQLRDTISGLEASLQTSLDAKNEETQALKQQMSQLQVDQADQVNSQLQASLDAKKEQITTLNNQIFTLQVDKTSARDEKARLTDQIHSLKLKLQVREDEFETTSTEHQKSISAAESRHVKEISRLERSNRKSEKTLQEMQTQLDEIENVGKDHVALLEVQGATQRELEEKLRGAVAANDDLQRRLREAQENNHNSSSNNKKQKGRKTKGGLFSCFKS